MAVEQISGGGPDEYFAFVESFDKLAAWSGGGKGGAMQSIVDPLLYLRAKLEFPQPAALVWLDCVAAQYFMQLDWRNETCEIGNAAESKRRREQIRALDRSKMRVVLLPLGIDGEDEGRINEEFVRAAWHRVVLAGESPGLPSATGPDFDLEADARDIRYVRHVRRCSEDEHSSLVNVFSLAFLPDADFGKGERTDPNTPPRPLKPRSGLALFKPFRREREIAGLQQTYAGEGGS